jgi:hypothetical protein
MKNALAIVAVVSCLAIGTHAADRPWTLVRSQNLTVVGQQSAKTLRGIAVGLEQFRAVLGSLIQNAQRPLPVPTVVYVFANHKELQPFLPMHDGRPAAIAGYFQHDGDINDIALALDGYDESARIVFHEYTHLLVQNAARSVPVWLSEGLAEYYSTYALEADGKRAHIGRPIVGHVGLLRERFIPLAQLIAVDSSSDLYNEGERRSIFYAEAWALTHYLMIQMPDGHAAINRYVTGIARGGTADGVFREAFGMAPGEFDKTLRAYVQRPVFGSTVFVFPQRVLVESPDPGRSISAPEAAAWLGDLQRRAGRREEASARIEAAAAAAPEAAMAQLALALLRVEQDRGGEASVAFDRAVALAPDDFLAHYAHGVSLLHHLSTDGSRVDPAGVARARAALARAVNLRPSSSDAFAWLAYADMLGEDTLAEAHAAIARAIDLAPGRLDYRLRYADICILRGALGDARTLLMDLSRVTTDRFAMEGAARRLAALDEREARLRAAAAAAGAGGFQPSGDAAAAADASSAAERRGIPKPADRTETARTTTDDAPSFKLRTVRREEQRAYGELTQVECGAGQVRFHLKVGERTVVAAAKRMEDVVLTEFVGTKDFLVSCGPRIPPDTVYLTWRMAKPRVEAGVTIVGEAVAVEFVPLGYLPQ